VTNTVSSSELIHGYAINVTMASNYAYLCCLPFWRPQSLLLKDDVLSCLLVKVESDGKHDRDNRMVCGCVVPAQCAWLKKQRARPAELIFITRRGTPIGLQQP